MQFSTKAKDEHQEFFDKDKAEVAELLASEDVVAGQFQPDPNKEEKLPLPILEEMLGKSLGEAKGDLIEKKYNFHKAKDVVVDMQEKITELTSWVVVGNEMKSIIAACALLVKFNKSDVYMKKKAGLFWEKLAGLLSPALFETVGKTDVAGVRKDLQDEQKLAFIKNLAYPGEFSEENAEQLSPAFKALFVYVRAAFEYRYADVKFRKAVMDAKEKAASEGGEEGAPPPPEISPEEIDDDFADIASITI